MQEIWKPIPGFEGLYEVSNMGQVRSLDRIIPDKTHGTRKLAGKVLKQTQDKQGRRYVVLSKHSNTLKKRVHLIVAEVFIGPRVTGIEVCHNDGNSGNNRADNLRYDTHHSNMQDMVQHGNSQRGEKCYHATTKEKQVHEIRKLRASGMMYKDIAATLGVGYYSVAKICAGSRWNWLDSHGSLTGE